MRLRRRTRLRRRMGSRRRPLPRRMRSRRHPLPKLFVGFQAGVQHKAWEVEAGVHNLCAEGAKKEVCEGRALPHRAGPGLGPVTKKWPGPGLGPGTVYPKLLSILEPHSPVDKVRSEKSAFIRFKPACTFESELQDSSGSAQVLTSSGGFNQVCTSFNQ